MPALPLCWAAYAAQATVLMTTPTQPRCGVPAFLQCEAAWMRGGVLLMTTTPSCGPQALPPCSVVLVPRATVLLLMMLLPLRSGPQAMSPCWADSTEALVLVIVELQLTQLQALCGSRLHFQNAML